MLVEAATTPSAARHSMHMTSLIIGLRFLGQR